MVFEQPAPPEEAGAELPPLATPAELDRVEADLAGVEQALARLDAGTYGTCEVCASPLDDQFLATTPTALRCGAHA
ncbi:MAG: hypothetical protein ACR2K0_09140 [Acidimicrobiales bacterium]|jgi:RNA polymerase-binding transcription factor DksA